MHNSNDQNSDNYNIPTLCKFITDNVDSKKHLNNLMRKYYVDIDRVKLMMTTINKCDVRTLMFDHLY